MPRCQLLWLLISIVLMHILILLGPQRCRVLLYKLINIGISSIYDLSIFCTKIRSKFLPKKINNTSGLSNFKSSVLIIVHTIPSMLAPNGQSFSTVHVNDLSSYLSSMLRCQMYNSVANFFDVGWTTHGVCVRFFLHHRFVFKLCQTCLSI